MKQTWKRFLLYGSLVIFGGVLLFLLEETIRLENTGFETKTLWDWMDLLVVPLFLTIIAIALNVSEKARDRKVAEDRSRLERQIETDKQQEAAFQAYLDRMAELLLDANLLATEDSTVRNVARVRTITVLQRLDGNRKGTIIKFLYEAGLITGKEPVISLDSAHLESLHLPVHTKLEGVNLAGTNMEGAILIAVNLQGGHLKGANLQKADLFNAALGGADLENVNMARARTRLIDLEGANLKGAFVPPAEAPPDSE